MSADEDREENHDRWLVSYADFITLMFAFFAVLFATAQKDNEKSQQFQESIKRYLIKAGGAGGSGGSAPQMNDSIKNNSVIESPMPTYNSPAKPETVKALDEAEAFIETQMSKSDREKFVIDVVADDWGVRLILANGALYSANSEKFREDAVPFLSRLGGMIAKTKRKILIEGHVAAGETGSSKSTWDFSSLRAVNLLRFLEKKESIRPDQLAVAALGDSRPLSKSGKSEQNSRIELVILNQEYEF